MRVGYSACLVLTALLGCEKPVIQTITVNALEDQPTIVNADVVVSQNMRPNSVVRIAPLVNGPPVPPQVVMTELARSNGIAKLQGSLPLSTQFPLAYGTTWTATVSVPYRVLWQDDYVQDDVTFVVGGGLGCSWFDGELRYQNWFDKARLHSVTNAHPDQETDVEWLADENARPSDATGALGIIVPSLQRTANEQWLARFAPRGVHRAWAGATGARVAIKSTENIDVHVSLLINRGLENGNPAAPVMEWIYTTNRDVPPGDWRTIEMPFPAFPAPVNPTQPAFIADMDVTAVDVRTGVKVVIDDVCPIHR